MKKLGYYSFFEWKNLLSKKQRKNIKQSKKECYENNKVRLREKARNKYRELSEKEQYIKREYGRNRYKNMYEEYKQRLKEYQKNYFKAKKSNLKNFVSFFI